jgi:hypothetical protein
MGMNATGLSICAKIADTKHPSEAQVNALYAIAHKIDVKIEECD